MPWPASTMNLPQLLCSREFRPHGSTGGGWRVGWNGEGSSGGGEGEGRWQKGVQKLCKRFELSWV